MRFSTSIMTMTVKNREIYMNISSKRAEYVALAALGLSIIFFVATMLIGFFSGATAAIALSW